MNGMVYRKIIQWQQGNSESPMVVPWWPELGRCTAVTLQSRTFECLQKIVGFVLIRHG